MTEEIRLLKIQIMNLENFVIQAHVRIDMLLRLGGVTEEQLEQGRHSTLKMLSELTIPGVEATSADAATGDLHEAAEGLIQQIRLVGSRLQPR